MDAKKLLDGPGDIPAALVVEMTTDERWTVPSGWGEGPLPLPYLAHAEVGKPAMKETDRAARSTYFFPRVATVLYGTDDNPNRWHRDLGSSRAQVGAATALAVELVRVPEDVRTNSMLAIVHLHLPCEDPIGALNGLVHLDLPSAPLRAFLDSHLGSRRIDVAVGVRRARSLALLRSAPDRPPGGDVEATGPANADQWLWLLASATPYERFRPDPASPPPPTTPMSASWRCLALRDGIGFIGLADESSDQFLRDAAPVHVRTLYLDVLLVAEFQRIGFSDLAEDLSDVNWTDGSSHLRMFERRLSNIRNAVWGSHLTQHAIADSILKAFQQQHRLAELLDEVQIELADAARLADLAISKRVEVLLTVLTVVASVSALVTVGLDHGRRAVVSTIGLSCLLVVAVLLAIERPQRGKRAGRR